MDPPSGAIVARGMLRVRLHFTEPVVILRRGLRITTPAGASETATVQTRGSDLLVRFAANAPGTYTLGFRVIDDDTHISRGIAAFSVGRPSLDVERIDSGQSAFASALSRTIDSIAHWMHYAGYALVFGTFAFALLMRRQFGGPSDLRVLRIGLVLMLAGDALSVLAQTAALDASHVFDIDAVGDVAASSFGRLAGIDLAGALLVWAVLPLLGGNDRAVAQRVILIDGVALAFVGGRMGHAIRALPWEASTFLSAVHLASMGLWLGTVVTLALCISHTAPEQRPGLLAGATKIAALSLLAASASGAVLLAGHLGGLRDLIASSYGSAVLAKVLLVAIAVIIGLVVRRNNGGAGWFAAESLTIGAALLAAGYALTLAPPR